MLYTSHIALGLVIGSVTGDYTAAITGSLVIDVDHLIPIIRTGAAAHPLKVISNALWEENAYEGDQRGLLHSLLAWAVISAPLITMYPSFGHVFSLAYLGHLLLDCINAADFFPLFPYKKINIKGPIGYASSREHIISLILLLFFVSFTFT